MWLKRILKALLILLTSLLGLLLLTFIVLNIPFSHRYITNKVNGIFNGAHLPISIGSVNRLTPKSLYAENVLIHGTANDTIIYAGKIKVDFSPIALLKNRVEIHDASISIVRVNFLRNNKTNGLNIAEAFSSGKRQAVADTTKKKKRWDVDVRKAELDNVMFRMTDSSGVSIDQTIGRIKVETDKMSIVERIVNVAFLEIDGATGTIISNHKKEKGNPAEVSPGWTIDLREFSAINTNQIFKDAANNFKLDLLSGELKIKTRVTDLTKRVIEFDNISISRTNLILNIESRNNGKEDSAIKTNFTIPWNIQGDKINLEEVSCGIYRFSDSTGHHPISNISATGLSMNLSGLVLNDLNQKADIENLSFDLGNGFSLKKMKTILDSKPDKTNFEIEAETEGSILSMNASVGGNLLSVINNHNELNKADIRIRKCNVSLTDLFCFKPDLQTNQLLSFLAAGAINLTGNLSIDGKVLTIPSLSLSRPSEAEISLSGKITNIFTPGNITGELKFGVNKLDYNLTKEILGIIKPGFSFPEFKSFTLEGTLSDSLFSPHISMKLASDLGSININGSVDFNQDLFSLKSDFYNIKGGKILQNELIGSLSGSADIKGSGIKHKNIYADASVLIDSLYLNKYTYTNSKIECKISKDNYDLRLIIDDPSMTLNFNAGLKTAEKSLSGRFDCNFRADLKKLHLFNDTLTTAGQIRADFEKADDRIKSNLTISGLTLEIPDKNVNIKSFDAKFESDKLSSGLLLVSDFLNGQIKIEKPVKDLGLFIKDYKKYLASVIDPHHLKNQDHNFSLPELYGKINIIYNDAFRIFIPDTGLIFRNISCSVISNVAKKRIDYKVKLTGVNYKKINIENLKVNLTDSASIMDLAVNADTCTLNSQPVNSVRLNSHFADWQSLTSLTIADKKSKVVYDFEIKSENDSNNIYLSIPSKQLILNGNIWRMDSSGLLKINRITKAISPSFEMYSENSFIKFHKNEKAGLQTYKLELSNVRLESLYRTDLLPGMPSATISGSTILGIKEDNGKKIDADMHFNDVRWSDLNYNQISLNGSFSSESPETFNFGINARLDSAEITMKGDKRLNTNRNIDIRINLLPVNSIQPFVKKFLSDLKGFVSGEFNLSTKNNIESLTGDLSIEDVNLKINSLNSSYRMPEDKIRFTGKKMILNSFRVLDSLNHELLIDGSVDFRNKNSVLADLAISTTNLQVMNRKEEKKSSFYGSIFVDTKLSVKGPVTSPVLRGKVALTRGTDIYFRQQDNLSMSESEKVLTFVSSKSSVGQKDLNSGSANSLINKTSIESVVEIDPETRISIELSKKVFNIGLVIKGGGELNYNMLINKQVNLSGKYEVGEGSADLKMIGWPNKAFKITKGGFIRWDGKIDDPEINIEAVNKVTSSYVNPVDNKERYVNFDVTLKISNRVSSMDIRFNLNTPDQYLMSIINTLSPEEQMRQAITILLFQNVDLPGISTTSNYVSEQVNQLVASQLNALTKTTIKGIDISFGIDSYVQANASGGQQTKTSLSYEVKRKLMNDRGQIELSGRINDGSTKQTSSSASLNNVSFEYRLDSAGTKFLKVYNEHTYEDVFEGEVIKTGVGLTYRKNYPTLGDIWRKDEEKKRRRDEETRRQREKEIIKQDSQDR